MTTATAAAKKTISLPGDLLAKALERSKEQNRSLSNYIANLVAKDVNGQLNVPFASKSQEATNLESPVHHD